MPPVVDGIAIWYLEAQARLDRACASFVTAAEVARAERSRHPEDAAAFLASRALLRAALAAHTGAYPRDLVLDHRCAHCGDPDHGRPTLGGAQAGAVEFSLTRTRPVVAVALSPAPVGLDAEPAPAGLDDAVASEVFSDEDRAWIGAAGGEARAARGLSLWVRKEAVGKASGLGIVDARAVHARPGAVEGEWEPARDARGRACHVAAVKIPAPRRSRSRPTSQRCGSPSATPATSSPPSAEPVSRRGRGPRPGRRRG